MRNIKFKRLSSSVWWFTAATVFTAIYMALILYACAGVRGTDQYWYLHDIEQLLSDNAPLTNTFWAGSYYRLPQGWGNNYFIHHTAVLYMVLPLGYLLGAYGGWIATGVLLMLCAGVCTGYVLWRLTGDMGLGYLGYFFFLSMPLSFWLCANMLQESLTGSLLGICVAAVLIGYKEDRLRLLLAGLCLAALGIWIHLIFVMLSALVLLVVWSAGVKGRIHMSTAGWISLSIAALAFIGFMFFSFKELFPSSGMPTITAIIQEHVPGRGNSEWHMYYDPTPLTGNLLWSKVVDAFGRQIQISHQLLFRLPPNILVLCCLWGLWRFRDSKMHYIYLFILSLLGMYAGLVCLHQNQFRTIFIISPALVVGGLLSLNAAGLKPAWVRMGLSLCCLFFLVVSCYMAQHLRRESLEQRRQVACIKEAAAYCKNSFLIPVPSQLAIYALKPNPVMIFKDSIASDPRSKNVLRRFKPAHAIMPVGSSAQWLEELPVVITAERPVEGTSWKLFDIHARPDSS